MEKSVKRNLIYNSTFQVILLLIPLITTPYVARVLGSESVGEFSFASAIVTFFSIFAGLGSSLYGQRLIAFNRDDREKMSESFWDVFQFRLMFGIFVMGLYFLYLHFFSTINPLTVIVSLTIINVMADITWFFTGIEEFRIAIAANAIIKTISLVFTFLFVKKSDDTWLYALIFCGSFVAGNLVLWVPLRKYISGPRTFRPFIHIKGMFLIFVPTIASQVYTILDKSMIGWITGSNYQNGCYEQSEKLARAALTVITAIGAVILPRVANLYKKGEMERARGYVYKSYRIIWALGFPIMFGINGIARMLIPVYLGEGYDLSVILLQVFSLLIIFVSFSYVTGISYLTSTNQQNIYSLSVIAAAVVNLVINLILIRNIGALGAAIASVTAEGIGVAIQLGYCFRKKQLAVRPVFETGIKYLIASLVMYGFILLTRGYFPVSVKSLLILVPLAGILYLIMLLILKDDLTLATIGRIRAMVKKRFAK